MTTSAEITVIARTKTIKSRLDSRLEKDKRIGEAVELMPPPQCERNIRPFCSSLYLVGRGSRCLSRHRANGVCALTRELSYSVSDNFSFPLL